jgi:hypothetical protein
MIRRSLAAAAIVTALFVSSALAARTQGGESTTQGAPATTAPPATQPAPATQESPSPAQAKYDALLARVKERDATVDLAELREAFTETPAYRATAMVFYQALWAPLNKGDFPGAVQVAEKVLTTNYVEINAHMVASIANRQLGNVPRAEYHMNIANGLLRVVMSKGDGASAETPWIVIDISEEYAVMRALNLSIQSQGLSMANGVNMDILQVIDMRTKLPRTLYFNVDRSMAAMSRSRQPPK